MHSKNFKKLILNEFNEHKVLINDIDHKVFSHIERAARLIIKTIKNKKKILIFGNGGSAADSIHFAAELSGKFRNFSRSPLPAISLSENISSITAIANDFSFEEIFSKQTEGLANAGDLLIGITTSGKSQNIKKAFNLKKKMKLKTILLCGSYKDYLDKYTDISLMVNSLSTARVQEIHILYIHLLCSILDEEF